MTLGIFISFILGVIKVAGALKITWLGVFIPVIIEVVCISLVVGSALMVSWLQKGEN